MIASTTSQAAGQNHRGLVLVICLSLSYSFCFGVSFTLSSTEEELMVFNCLTLTAGANCFPSTCLRCLPAVWWMKTVGENKILTRGWDPQSHKGQPNRGSSLFSKTKIPHTDPLLPVKHFIPRAECEKKLHPITILGLGLLLGFSGVYPLQ